MTSSQIQCERQVGKGIKTIFRIIHTGDSGQFQVDFAKEYRVNRLEFTIRVSDSEQRNVSATALVPRIAAKLKKKLKNAVFIWQNNKMKATQLLPICATDQVYTTPTDPGLG